MPSQKVRLDELLVARGCYADLGQAARAVLAGDVTSPRIAGLKPGTKLSEDEELTVKGARPFVSRGGEKLAAALEAFALDVGGMDCLDIGTGSGGFADCLLQAGAAHVTAVDVGYGQFDYRLRQDPRVRLLERTNFRLLTPGGLAAGSEAAGLSWPLSFDLAVADLSFIRTSGLLGHIRQFLKPGGQVLILIKPQFELADELAVAPGFVDGVVCDPGLHERVLTGFIDSAAQAGFAQQGLMASPLLGPEGNREFLFWATLGGRPATIDISQILDGLA